MGTHVVGFDPLQLQSAFGAWWVSVDIDHSGFPLAYCEFVVGAVVVVGSWFVAPELFNPRLGRPWVAAIIVGILGLMFALSAVKTPPSMVDLVVYITFVAGLIAGSRVEARKVEPTDHSSGVPVDG